jgi:lipopolysaccharide/colanic/teichoic acid biosynthesis glycosyltransferase
MWSLVQRVVTLVGVIVLSPVLALLMIAIRATSPGPALHRAERVGPSGTFGLLKLRTMVVGAAGDGPGVTAEGDPRVTRLGRFLRRTKADELPQLWNVVRGDMALVGPRPEDPRYVDLSDPIHRFVFSARPGITGPTALAFRDEERMLAAAAREVAEADGRRTTTDADVDRAYRDTILPAKLAMDAEYLGNRSWRGDLALIGRTIGQVLGRTAPP